MTRPASLAVPAVRGPGSHTDVEAGISSPSGSKTENKYVCKLTLKKRRRRRRNVDFG